MWPLKEITLEERQEMKYSDVEPGTCWRVPLNYLYPSGQTYAELNGHLFSPRFLASGRDYVIVVRLPRGGQWDVDHGSSNGDGWVVTGELPNITVSPSIDSGSYHGFLQNGALTADVEGRTFEQEAA